MLHKSQLEFLHDHIQEKLLTSTPENIAKSCDDEINTQLPKKRRGTHKKVVSVVIGGGDDPRSKAEIHPPQDSWSWRKYGQKPIKGSPYPRGYYRCSSSKGCPAKKQVERSCLDSDILLVTYSGEHNHSQSRTTKLHRISHLAATSTDTPVAPISITSNSTSSSSNASDVPSTLSPEKRIVATDINDLSELTGELGWFSQMGSIMLENSDLMGPDWADMDVNVMLPIREEDQSLFGDLEELEEGSVVFRRGIFHRED